MPSNMGQKTAEETFIAIDFGTRASRIAHAGSETKPLIGDLTGEMEIPAALTLSKEGGMLAGLEAHAHAVLLPAETVLSLRALFTQGSPELVERGPFFPHALGDSQLLQVEVGGRRRLPMELAALYLLHLRRTAELALERPVESVVLTVPVVFTALDRQAYRLSARMAGFRRVRLIDESTAAALAALAAGVQGRVAVCSWGAGFLSLALVELRRDIVKVLAAAGSSQAGGERVELALARDFLARVREAGLSFENETHVARHILMAAAKALPEIASRGEAEVQVRLADQRQPFRQVYRRDDIQTWLEPLKETATTLGKRLAGDLHLLPGDVDALVLAGGVTRFDSVRKHLVGFYRRAAVDSIDPLEAAVRGALVRAQFLNRETPQPLVLDSLPWSVGV
ncbi:MAG: Hsp70 family protein, partial [Candidatus Eisenbacteria bacterium]